MRCREARRALAGLASTAVAPAALDQHVARCAACREDAAIERAVTAALDGLGGELPFEIDVHARVLAALDRVVPVRVREVDPRELAWATLVALGLGAALVAGLVSRLPALDVVAARWATARRLAGVLAQVLGDLLTIPERLGASALTALAGTAPLVARLAGPLTLLVVAATAAMALTIVAIVARDLRVSTAMAPGGRT